MTNTPAAVGFIFIIFLIFYIPTSTRYISTFILLLALIVLIINVIGSTIYTGRELFKNHSNEFLVDLSEDSKKQILLMQKISTFSQWDIKLAIQRMDFELQNMQSKMGFLVGAMDKLGIVPAIIAVYISIEKIMDNQAFGLLHFFALSFVIGIYIGVITVTKVNARYKYYHMVLCASLELASERDAYQNSKAIVATTTS